MQTGAHGRRGTIRLARAAAFLTTVVSMIGTVAAQTTDVVTYYHTDATGSVRMITDANGQVLERHDYLPFGQEGTPASSEHRLFVGKERDQETGLDYSGARYYSAQSGRFTSPDPIAANEARLVNPQRWNRYTYAANNPLTFGDPDGLDVIVFNFMNGANGAGHLGIMVVDPNTGAGLYGGFNPAHPHRPYDAHGVVAQAEFPAGSIQFTDGRPTRASLEEIKAAVAKRESYQHSPIRTAYFKTTETQTSMLRDFITRTQQHPPPYNVLGYNCQSFCILGLRTAGINAPAPEQLFRAEPNVYFALTLSELAWRLGSVQIPKIETSYCFQGEKGCSP